MPRLRETHREAVEPEPDLLLCEMWAGVSGSQPETRMTPERLARTPAYLASIVRAQQQQRADRIAAGVNDQGKFETGKRADADETSARSN